jgi:peptidoglycan/LPS O-acetylase OafA/YrhL
VLALRGHVASLDLTASGLHITVLELGVALLLLALAGNVGNTVFSRWTTWIQFVGRSSYEIYLTHMFVVLGMMQLFKSQQGHSLIPVWYAAMLLLSIALGYLVSRFYSEPANVAIRTRAYPSTGSVGVTNVS